MNYKNQINKWTRYGNENLAHDSTFVVNWNLGTYCNYKCSYCPPYLHDGNKPWMDAKEVMRFSKKLYEHYAVKLGKNLYIEFSGGEVTYHPQIIEICQELSEMGVNVGIISNGSRTSAFWEKIVPFLKHVCLSYHTQTVKSKTFFENALLIQKSCALHVNIMMNSQYFDQCRMIGNKIANHSENISISFQPIYDRDGKYIEYAYHEIEELNTINQSIKIKWTKDVYTYRGYLRRFDVQNRSERVSVTDVLVENSNHWMGWLCWSGVDHIVIDFDGDVYRAWCKQDRIGSLYEEESLVFPVQPTICRREICDCNLDILCRKELLKTQDYGETFRRSVGDCKFDRVASQLIPNSAVNISRQENVLFWNVNGVFVNDQFAGIMCRWSPDESHQDETIGLCINGHMSCPCGVEFELILAGQRDYDRYHVVLNEGFDDELVVLYENLRQKGWGDVVMFEPKKVVGFQILNKTDKRIMGGVIKVEFLTRLRVGS